MRILFSHYSPVAINDALLAWEVTGNGFELSGAQLLAAECSPFEITELGFVSFETPHVQEPTMARIEIKLFNDEQLTASTYQEIYIFPELVPSGEDQLIYSPEFRSQLEKLGYSITNDLSQTKLAVVTVLDDTFREFVLRGGRVLLLAEDEDALQMRVPGLDIEERDDSAWQGDWASTFGWHRFDSLPTGGTVNFAFAGITPEYVIGDFSGRDFAFHVYAGLFAGWLHKPVPTIARRRMAQGEVLVSTFQLSRNLDRNPLAMYLFAELIKILNGHKPTA